MSPPYSSTEEWPKEENGPGEESGGITETTVSIDSSLRSIFEREAQAWMQCQGWKFPPQEGMGWDGSVLRCEADTTRQSEGREEATWALKMIIIL